MYIGMAQVWCGGAMVDLGDGPISTHDVNPIFSLAKISFSCDHDVKIFLRFVHGIGPYAFTCCTF